MSLKTPEEYIERNIKAILEQNEKPESFGVTYVQRRCLIGYNQAFHTIEEMERRGMICVVEDRPWHYRFIDGFKGDL